MLYAKLNELPPGFSFLFMTDMRAVFVFLTYSWQESKSFPKIYDYSFNSWDADSS